MQSADQDHFFETDASQVQRARKAAKAGNKHGDPLEMKSKILAAVPDPMSPSSGIFIAESAGYVRQVKLSLSQPHSTTYRGPKAPVTCLAIGAAGNSRTIFAGSWDKDIWSWDVESTQLGRKYSGHADFVKAVLCAKLKNRDILISGGADKKIIVWDVETGRRLHTIQDATTTMLAIQHLALDPALSTRDELVLVSASSDPHIRRWKIGLDDYEQITETFADRPGAERSTIEEHDTSVYRLVFDTDGEDADLWTASADGTAKCLSRSRNFVAEDCLNHGDYVRSVQPTEQWVITAGRDENVKVWDRATGKLYCSLEGHFEEITDLVLLRGAQGSPEKICSVSIDRTIRTWPLQKTDLDDVVRRIEEAKKPSTDGADTGAETLVTAEEEAELAELMDD
ncbi:WD40 repeat-like-containing domain protein [Metarhizium album ARSEF 1941]|uniref:WD40 repeat-like-containing domain protein n=1 Tax=Metarhizium album (strain ARSEF 1941) TaxID=1081103 RepID=A0A0B2WYV8_METAS|nr:WD40 repeat-like-containing domain protein [Metarhizium album ARSEF 1941]KHN99223.1 WD40 repeat-like-containing domain protein [Metarhizium album ARSEF 1941]